MFSSGCPGRKPAVRILAILIAPALFGAASGYAATPPSSSTPWASIVAPNVVDTAYITVDTINHVIGLNYTGVLAATFFIIDGHIVPTSLLPSDIVVGWQFEGPYTNLLSSPLGPGPNGVPSFGAGPMFTYTGSGRIAWAEASDPYGRLIPVEYPGGAYHGCGYQWSGNVDCDPAQLVDLSDLTRLIDYLFISRDPLCCEGEANCDGLPGIDIGDLSRLIDFLYITGTPPAPCR